MSETKEIPAHIRLLGAGFHMAPKSTGSRWLAWDALASACSETDDLDYASVAESVRSAAPVYAAAPELLEALDELSLVIGLTAIKHEGQRDVLQKSLDKARTLIATVKRESNE